MYPNGKNLIATVVENNDIFQVMGAYGAQQKTQIGVTLAKYEELKNLTEQYYNILVEKGIIVKEKTSQELLQDQIKEQEKTREAFCSVLDYVKKLEEKVDNLTDLYNGKVIETKCEEKIKEGNEIIITEVVPKGPENSKKGFFK